MDQGDTAKLDIIKDEYNKCYDLMVERDNKILLEVGKYPNALNKVYRLDNELQHTVRDIERLVIETGKLFNSGVFDRCGINLKDCIKTIDKVIANMYKQIELVKTATNKVKDDADALELLEYETRLSQEIVVFKDFKACISKISEQIVS